MLTKRHFAAMYNRVKQEKDEKNAHKVVDLFEKYQSEQYHICFAGHFSAGKSSLINYLLGKEVLPKSPIPTSANIVKITSGERVVRVFFNDAPPVQYEEPYDIDVIKDYCMDRDTIKQIEISLEAGVLPEKSALLDTPGIDAADDADRLMTESALHLIDVLFYVMDYNHVQSEVNLYFLQKMQRQGIPIYLIINQIDKHNEAELTFFDYDKIIKQTFDQWEINPEAIYYSSMFDQNHPANELAQLKADIFRMMENQQVTKAQINRSMAMVISDHKRFIREHAEDLEMDQNDAEEQEVIEKRTAFENRLSAIKEKEMKLKKDFYDEVQLTLKNAYLMPATLRDLAGDFLTSQEKDFKIGFFQAKKKTAEEQIKRLTLFLNALQQTIETTVQWKLREKTVSLLQETELTDPALLKKAQEFTILFDEKDIFSYLKSGAMVNGNYIINYTNDISSAIKNKFRIAANELWKIIEENAEDDWQAEKMELEEKLAFYRKQIAILEEQSQVFNEIKEKETRITEEWAQPSECTDVSLFSKILDEKGQIHVEKTPEKITVEPKQAVITNQKQPQEEQVQQTSDVDSMTTAIDGVLNEISDMSAFSALVRDLQVKKNRLENRELTIALFGTFSAGKSSFSNALFGERILPVSPNPTTAVISRIRPITVEQAHGSVLITLKDDAALMDDLLMITKHIGTNQPTLKDWIEWIEKERIYEHRDLTGTYQAYLRALIAGYDTQQALLGETVSISLEDFAAFVTDETKACYIQHVDLYYDCGITRKGITLVDTPGADSVNARHTSVAFDYIKEADAILYVTYYNHAITSGDRDFLMQLGRVKEAFAMDKMFFIVNASDLAESKEDLMLVVQYVTEQLVHFGIRNAKIFPVSSKLSLEEKLAGNPLNEEMSSFEQAFYTFIDTDLVALIKESAVWEMNRAEIALAQFIQSLELNESERNHKIAELRTQRTNSSDVIKQLDKQVFIARLSDRIDRQLHFVLDRLYIRFHDMFTDYFNPSTINKPGKLAHEQLEHNRNQLIDYVGYELLQEIRAVSLRIESYMNELMQEAYTINQQDVLKLSAMFVLPSREEVTFVTPAFKQAFDNLELSIFKKPLKMFKNAKSFFEQNEREQMKEAFYDCLRPYAKKYITETKQIMNHQYNEQWSHQMQGLQEKALEEITVIVNEHSKMLSETVDVAGLKEKHRRIHLMMEKWQ